MINHGSRNDDADESIGVTADDDHNMFLAEIFDEHTTTFREDSTSGKVTWGIHGSDPGAEMLSESSTIDVQVRQWHTRLQKNLRTLIWILNFFNGDCVRNRNYHIEYILKVILIDHIA